jgi:HEAT repeats
MAGKNSGNFPTTCVDVSIRGMRRNWLSAVVLALACAFFTAPVVAGQSQPGEIVGQKLLVPGKPVHGTTSQLSEVEREMVDAMGPQQQAERLLQYAISHHRGATDEIKARVMQWRGQIKQTESLTTLMDVALNGDDLRVRAAVFEIDLAVANLVKSSEEADALLRSAEIDQQHAEYSIWYLGWLANRGVEVERIHSQLLVWAHSENEQVRLRAVSAIADIGTDDTVPDLVEAFHHDPSFRVRIDGAGCGLAHCGMLTRAQRMQAVPGLIEMVDDKKLDAETVKYGYRALREITDQTLGDEVVRWRDWYAAHGAEVTERFRQFQKVMESQP